MMKKSTIISCVIMLILASGVAGYFVFLGSLPIVDSLIKCPDGSYHRTNNRVRKTKEWCEKQGYGVKVDSITYRGRKFFRTSDTFMLSPISEKYRILDLQDGETVYHFGEEGTPKEQVYSLKLEDRNSAGKNLRYTFWEDAGGQLERAIKEANYCEDAGDCAPIGIYCPFSGPYSYVHKDKVIETQQMIEGYEARQKQLGTPSPRCEYPLCRTAPPQCVNNRCVAECLIGSEDFNVQLKTEHVSDVLTNPENFIDRPVLLEGTLLSTGGYFSRDFRLYLQDVNRDILDVQPWLPMEVPPFPTESNKKYPSVQSDFITKRVKLKGQIRRRDDDGSVFLWVETAEIIGEEVRVKSSIEEALKTPHLFEGKSLTLNGTLIVSEVTYSGVNEAPSGIQREFFLSNGKDSISLDLSEIKSTTLRQDRRVSEEGMTLKLQ